MSYQKRLHFYIFYWLVSECLLDFVGLDALSDFDESVCTALSK